MDEAKSLQQAILKSVRDVKRNRETPLKKEVLTQSKSKVRHQRTPVAIGEVTKLKDGVCYGKGLRNVKAGEVVYIASSRLASRGGIDFNTPLFVKGLTLNLNFNEFSVILFNNESMVQAGDKIFRSTRLLEIPVSLSLFGNVISALAEMKTEIKEVKGAPLTVREKSSVVEIKAAGIVDRVAINIPLRTGLKAVDSLVPIGRGQRELIIGDRQTGKTSVAIDVILNHTAENNRLRDCFKAIRLRELQNIMWFVYAAIGQKQSSVVTIFNLLKKKRAEWYTCIVAATAAESAPLQFLCPYTACTLGEYIRDFLGGHSTVIYDDLSKHAVAYRQMSLLLRRPPGREAFPGDVFYLHSRLLERAGALRNLEVAKSLRLRSKRKRRRNHPVRDRRQWLPAITTYKRGTLTAFPIIETQLGDVSAYIPTNVISITDGQIFLETELFYKGVRPAINVGLSVSRVGSAAQPPLMKKVSGSLKMELAQYREVESFAKLGSSLDPFTQKLLIRGENLIEILKQNVNSPLTTTKEILSIFLGLGFSSSWLSQILANLKVSSASFITAERFNSSWFELFSTFSTSFKSVHVGQFIRSFLSFYETLGLTKIFDLPYVEKLNSIILAKFPNYFFDDLTLAYLFEGSLVINEKRLKSKNRRLNKNLKSNLKGKKLKKKRKGSFVLMSLAIFKNLKLRTLTSRRFNKSASSYLSLPTLLLNRLKRSNFKNLKSLYRFFPFLQSSTLTGNFETLPSLVKSFFTLFYSFRIGGANRLTTIKYIMQLYITVGQLLSETTSVKDQLDLVKTLTTKQQNQIIPLRERLLTTFYHNWALFSPVDERGKRQRKIPFESVQSRLSIFYNNLKGRGDNLTKEMAKSLILQIGRLRLPKSRYIKFRKSIARKMRRARRYTTRLTLLNLRTTSLFLRKIGYNAIKKRIMLRRFYFSFLTLNLYRLKFIGNLNLNSEILGLNNFINFINLRFNISEEILKRVDGRKLFSGLIEIIKLIVFKKIKKGANWFTIRTIIKFWFAFERNLAVKRRRAKRKGIFTLYKKSLFNRSVRSMLQTFTLSQINLNRVVAAKSSTASLVSNLHRWELAARLRARGIRNK